MDYKVLYDKDRSSESVDGLTRFSDILFIPVGQTALLSLYNMYNAMELVTDPTTGKKSLKSDNYVTIHKLTFGPTGDVVDIAKTLECGETVHMDEQLQRLLAKRSMRHEPVYQNGCEWVLNPCNNFALIPVPGFYVLEFHDSKQFDTAYVEYALLSVADSMAIPNEFKLGS